MHDLLHPVLVHATDTAQRLANDAGLRGQLRRRFEVHPPAPTTTGEPMQAHRHDPIVRRFDDRMDAPEREVLLRFDHVDLDQLARQGSRDEDDPAVVTAPHGVAAGDEAVGPNGQLHHRSVWQLQTRTVGVTGGRVGT